MRYPLATPATSWFEGFAHPRVDLYESRKGLKVITQDSKIELDRIPCFSSPAIKHLLARDSLLEHRWNNFFGRRIAAAVLGKRHVPALFPGHTVPAPGSLHLHDHSGLSGLTGHSALAGHPGHNAGTGLTRFRGSLLLDQLLELSRLTKSGGPWRDTRPEEHRQPDSQSTGSGIRLCTTPVNQEIYWPWKYIPRPSLSFIAEIEPSQQGSPESGNSANDWSIDSLGRQCHALRDNTASLLALIHSFWTSNHPVPYEPFACQLADLVLLQLGRNRSAHLHLLFELEAFASYVTMSGKLRPLYSGMFAGNWLEISLAPLDSIRGTELCVPSRLLDEVITLRERGFAPLVINEYGSVSDGNHRLTTCWIWNVLAASKDCIWEVGNREFEVRLASTLARLGAGPVTTHEVLRNLALMLISQADGKGENEVAKLRRLLADANPIAEVPVVFLPEYLSGAVQKDDYDAGRAVRRARPELYAAMSSIQDAVLPARASYHFTDCALLPWFQIV